MFELAPLTKSQEFRFFVTKRISRIAAKLGMRQRHLAVCGFPRSGTSLMYNMMSSTAKTYFKFTKFEHYFIYYLHKLGSFATKAPLDVLHMKYLDDLNIHDKDIIVLVLVRDIREIITSKHPVIPDEYFIGYDHSWWPQDESFDSWVYDAPGIIEISSAINALLKRDDVKLIKYEDLTDNPDVVQLEIKEKYGLKFNGQFSKYHERPKRMAYKYDGKYRAKDKSLVLEGGEIKKKSVRWKKPEHRERIVDQFTRCPELFDVLIKYGYEKNRLWFDSFIE